MQGNQAEDGRIRANSFADPSSIALDRELEDEDDVVEGKEEEDEEFEGCSENDDDDDVIAQLLASDCPHKDATMRISPQEREWALTIKQAVEDDNHLKMLTDMEYAQYAIICEGDLDSALRRISGIQDLRDTYSVDNSVEQGLEILAAVFEQQPGYVLCIDVDSVTLEGLHVIDVGNCDPLVALSVHPTKGAGYNWKVFVLSFYYMSYACQPCLRTVRAGNYTMGDFSTLGWSHLNMEFQTRMANEILSNYPIKFSKFLAFNTGFVANVCWSVIKKIYPPTITGILQLGCKVPLVGDQNIPLKLEETYLQPSMAIVYEKLLLRAQDLLTLRRKNEELFRL